MNCHSLMQIVALNTRVSCSLKSWKFIILSVLWMQNCCKTFTDYDKARATLFLLLYFTLLNWELRLKINLPFQGYFCIRNFFKLSTDIYLNIPYTHTHTQTLTQRDSLKGCRSVRLLTTCIVLIFMKRSSRCRPRRQLAAQLFAQSKEEERSWRSKRRQRRRRRGDAVQHQLAPLCIVWPRATHSKRLRISSEPPQQRSPKSFRYCQIARESF